MKSALIIFAILSASSLVAEEKPWHEQPMDLWAPGECYRSPSTAGFTTDRADPVFKIGDVVVADDIPGETFKVIGEKEWHHFLKSGKHAYGYRVASLKDGNKWWLSPSRMQLAKDEVEKRPILTEGGFVDPINLTTKEADARHRKNFANAIDDYVMPNGKTYRELSLDSRNGDLTEQEYGWLRENMPRGDGLRNLRTRELEALDPWYRDNPDGAVRFNKDGVPAHPVFDAHSADGYGKAVDNYNAEIAKWKAAYDREQARKSKKQRKTK